MLEWFRSRSQGSSYSMNEVYRVAGITKQAHFQMLLRLEREQVQERQLVPLVRSIRQKHPRIGCKKLYKMINPDQVGRDRFMGVLKQYGLLVRGKRNYHRTTYSMPSVRYKNLISGREFTGVNQCWVSDITYIRVKEQFKYLVLITDVFSKKILGWSLNDSLHTSGNLQALKMAFKTTNKQNLKGLIHHSDRGTQYGSDSYTKQLESYGIRISMGSKAWENGHAERINGILKQEYIEPQNITGVPHLYKTIKESIRLYHQERPHWSLPGMSTPDYFIKMIEKLNTNYKVKINY